jgi:hypothetical protein
VALRGPFFAAPLALVMVLGFRARRDAGALIALSALVVSTAWCLLCLAKIGSASNYFLEPCVAAVIVLARADLPPLSPRARASLAAAALVQLAWNGVATVKSAAGHIASAYAQRSAVAALRETCGSTLDDVVLADEPGLERMIDGRIVATPFQSTHLARRGRFPVDRWLADIARPEVTCLVMQDDLLERPPSDVRVEHDRFGPELRRALTAEFVLVTERAGLWIYRRRPSPERTGSP